ncbi:aminopeptidase N [Pseudoalteromonas sp. MMG013]|uniref:aminopeptidase N n=1 Tax=Pseudoalteromonas sp. MMG013 TaxID=2822687 RepID=UPI001B365B2C|nr:aminopeptidase N [Pseudoalteromonas sp. MMG013]MBQ4863390.1 aminopeptidase N [Pseudoalteromonas sp. MMG013]
MQEKPQAKYLKDYQPPSHTVSHLDLSFDLQPTNTKVISIAHYNAISDTTDLRLDGIDLKLLTLKVNGKAHTQYEQSQSHLLLTELPSSFDLEISTEISPSTNTSLEGLYQSAGAYCTQCEAEGFRKITYFLDRPDVLTTYDVKIVADKSIPYLLSNGNKIEDGVTEDGRHYAKWQDPFKKPSYLFALVAGDFDVLMDEFITQSGRAVELALFVDKGNLDKAPHAVESLKRAMAWDESRFNLEYDLDIYMIVAVDFFNMGAMENKGLNVFNSACVLANQQTATDRDYHTIESIVGHEYFHNWTGNRVTCRDWFQLSLKEGLTVFRDQEFSSDLGSRGLNRIDAVMAMRAHQFTEDAGPMAHSIRPQKVIEMNNFYTVTVYNKGAEVIRMMHSLLGEQAFQKGMKLYVDRHDGQAVTCDDFVNAMQDASGVELTQFKRWYEQVGTPTIEVVTSFDPTKQTFIIELTQHRATNDPVVEPLHIPFALELLGPDGEILPLICNSREVSKILNVTNEHHQFVFEGFEQEPVPVLLEDFSAPCIIQYNYKLEQLIHIIQYASSDYARWEAMQQAFSQEVFAEVNKFDGHITHTLNPKLMAVLKQLLTERNGDIALIAELMSLPNFDALSAGFTQVPVNALVKVIKDFKHDIAVSLTDALKTAYVSAKEQGELSHDGVSARALKNTCLYYLAYVADEDIEGWLETQSLSENMTLKLGALKAATAADLSCTGALMENFDAAWRHDLLVMDKWFSLQATIDSNSTIDNLYGLYNHPCFDKSNPNRVRALVGSFARSNPAQFHREDGAGYKLLGDLLIELNGLNPQNASRMVTPFMSWKKFDKTRQELMKAQLQRLADLTNLSDDLYEKVEKALS